MTPSYFGLPSRRMFGIHHAPGAARRTDRAVLLVSPFGHEALRIHRFYRLLAERLSRQGVAVLRFDAYGTGDSAGDDDDVDLQGWSGDILQAHRELARLSGATRIRWLGSRLGANAAMLAAASDPAPAYLDQVVAWDPIPDGRAYLAALGRAQLEELQAAFCVPRASWRPALEKDPLAMSAESLGFAISPRLRSQILALQPDLSPPRTHVRTCVLMDEGDENCKRWMSSQAAASPEGRLRFVAHAHSLAWTSNAFANSELVPAKSLQLMQATLLEDA